MRVALRTLWALGIIVWSLTRVVEYWLTTSSLWMLWLGHAVLPELLAVITVIILACFILSRHVQLRRKRFGVAIRPGVARLLPSGTGGHALPLLPQEAQQLILSYVPPKKQDLHGPRPLLLKGAQRRFLNQMVIRVLQTFVLILACSIIRHSSTGYRLTAQRLRTKLEIATHNRPPVPEQKDDMNIYMYGAVGLLVIAWHMHKKPEDR